MLFSAPAASGALRPVASGEARLELGRGLYAQLREHDVQTMKLRRGRVQGRFATVPVGGGELDPVSGEGGVMLGGGVKFRLGARRAALGGLVFNPAKRTLLGKIRGQAMRIATASDIAHTRDGFGADFVAERLLLTGRAAKGLNHQLGVTGVFKAGKSLGAASVSVQPETVDLAGGTTILTGDEGVFGKLKSLDVEVVPFEAATVLGSTPPSFAFPHFPYGSMALGPPFGVARGETGLRLIQKGGTPELPVMSPVMSLVGLSVSLESSIVSAGVSVHFSSGDPGLYGTTPIADLDMAVASTTIDPVARTIAFANLRATINQFLADKLNETFAAPGGKGQLFQAGEPLGILSITAQAQ